MQPFVHYICFCLDITTAATVRSVVIVTKIQVDQEVRASILVSLYLPPPPLPPGEDSSQVIV